MKQTILSKCFGKMKRVALTLFAALCVGSVWAEEGEGTEVTYVTTPMEDPSAGYIRTGLGTYGNEVAVVFTNHTAEATWTAPYNLYNVEFLVVGGGGGGGSDMRNDDNMLGGAGGGGGGVVTGRVNFVSSSSILVTVGNGGAGGRFDTENKTVANRKYAYNRKSGNSNYYGAGVVGSASSFGIGAEKWVTAKGGGRDAGTSSRTATTGRDGSSGGSGGGGRPGKNGGASSASASDYLADKVICANSLGFSGGNGCNFAYSGYGNVSGGGGGGATAPGTNGTHTEVPEDDVWNDLWYGGSGGEGLPSDITGDSLVYGSGGGGGSIKGYGGQGGTGAGNGGHIQDGDTTYGKNALVNQGGGGGGASNKGVGGAGGSGIVVFRYEQLVDFSELSSRLAARVYNGNVQTIEDSVAYTVTGENKSAIEYGTYSVIITPKDGYLWPDTKTNEGREYAWSITQAPNEWISDVKIDKTSWTVGIDVAGVITLPAIKFGDITATISKDGAEAIAFDGTMPEENGVFVVTYYPETTENYSSEALAPQTISFTVFTPEAIPEYSFVTGTYSIDASCKAVIPYEVICEATSTKTLNMYVCYTIVGSEVTTTNLVRTIEGVKGSGNCEIADLKPGAEYIISFFGDIEGTLSELSTPITVTVPSVASNLSVSSTFVNDPMEFRVSGSVVPGLGTTVVKVYWALNDDAQLETNEAKVFTFTLGENEVEFGKSVEFVANIPYASSSDKLFWRVEVENSITTDTWGTQTFAGPATDVAEKVRKDLTSVRYTWTGNGTPNEKGVYSWTDIANWSSSVTDGECIGYPGTFANDGAYYKYYASVINFNQAGEGHIVDLGGQRYTFKDAGDGFVFDEGARLTLTNGAINVNADTLTIGAAGSLIEFSNVDVTRWSVKKDGSYENRMNPNVYFAANSTNIFSGTMPLRWYFSPASGAGSKLILRDGTLTTSRYKAENPTEGTEVEINNAVWNVETTIPNGIASVIKFRDGVDRQARIRTTTIVKIQGIYDIKLPQTPYQTSYAEYSSLSTADTCSFRVDATDFDGEDPVALINFNGTLDDNTKAAMTAMVESNMLTVVVDGVEIDKSTRNARLVWDETAKTLYYQQDTRKEASIGTAEYPTLGAALEAAEDGDTIKLLNDIELKSYLEITKSLTLDLNGQSITRTDSTDNSTALFVNAADAIVTITGDGTVTADHAVYVNAGKVIIESGTFSAGTHAVYVINNGHAEIKGGTFSSEDGQYHYVLNEYDATRDATSIVVTGGTFVGFNPANNTAEVDNTNFCADGYTTVAGEEEGTWVVQKAISELKPGTPVTDISATDEDEAINKVKLTVEVPAGANITKDDYANYFKLVATETSEGSGVWEVAAVLDDTKVTPVIAATTDENGVVTPAITFEDGKVTVNIENELPGLYYGVRYATTVEAVETIAPVAGLTVTPAAGDTAGFFKVVVDFKPIPEAE